MVIVAARPGQGKSTFALDIARSASIKHSLASVIFSLEMSQIEITMRLLSAEPSIPLSHIRGGRMSDDDWARVASKMGQVSEAPMFIDDSPNLTMMEIRAKARRLKQRHDLKLVVIDYIQLMSGKKGGVPPTRGFGFSRQLKLLAKELDVPVVALSQLNRGPEQRNDKRPMLADLRESGSLEQDADIVLLLNRPDMYDKDSERARRSRFRRGETSQRPHEDDHRRLPGPLFPVHRHAGLDQGRCCPRASTAVSMTASSVPGSSKRWLAPGMIAMSA